MALTYKAGIAKDGKVWRCRVVHQGKVFKRTCESKRDAERYVAAVRDGDVARFERPTQAQRMESTSYNVTVEQLCEALTDPLANARRTANGKRDVRQMLDVVRRRFGMLDVGQLDADAIIKWAGELVKDRKPATVRQYVNTLHALLTEARAIGMLPTSYDSPVPRAREVMSKAKSKLVGNGDEVGRRVSDEEIKDLCRVADPVMAGIIRFAVESSFRSGEICALKWGDIDWDAHTVRILDQKQKKQGTRVAPMTPEMEALLVAQMPKGRAIYEDEPVFPRCSRGGVVDTRNPHLDSMSVTQRFGKIRERAGVEHVRFHDLRHEACSRLGELVIPGLGYLNAIQIQAFSGHRTLDMVQRYVHADVSTFAAQLHAGGPKGQVVKGPWREQA